MTAQSLPEKVATAAQYVGGGGAAIFGLTPSEWSVIGVIGGLLIAALGYITSTWFKAQHLKLAQEAARRGVVAPLSDSK